MQQKLIAFFNDFSAVLTLYDYLGFALLGLFFIFFIILSIVVRQKPLAALLFAFLAFVMVLAGPLGVKEVFDRIVRSSDVTIEKTQKLQYSEALIIQGSFTHTGKIEYSRCTVTVDIYQDRKNRYLNLLQRYMPVFSKTVQLPGPLPRGQTRTFETTIESFAFEKSFLVHAYGECYP